VIEVIGPIEVLVDSTVTIVVDIVAFLDLTWAFTGAFTPIRQILINIEGPGRTAA